LVRWGHWVPSYDLPEGMATKLLTAILLSSGASHMNCSRCKWLSRGFENGQ
jgi:hypothetical protein